MERVDGLEHVVVLADRGGGGGTDLGAGEPAVVAERAAEQEGGEREEREDRDRTEGDDGPGECCASAHRTRHVPSMPKH